jgi:hypothetical protein
MEQNKRERISRQIMNGLFLIVATVFFQSCNWPDDPAVNLLISNAPLDQLAPEMTTDELAGAIIAWYDWRGGTPRVYAQRVSVGGTLQWQSNGVALCAATSNQAYPDLVPDGAQGAIVAWHDQREANSVGIHAQRISGTGQLLWGNGGVPICQANGIQEYVQVVADGYGGAVMTWIDGRNGTNNKDIYAQRVDSNGNVLWQINGVPICTASGLQFNPYLISLGEHGVVITWYDKRSGNFDIYAQRIALNGSVVWQTNGKPVCTAGGNQLVPQIISDSQNGAIITWEDERAGPLDENIYAQRIDQNGNVQWAMNGVAVCNAIHNQSKPHITSDAQNGAIITWYDMRNGDSDIYAQKINSAGTPQWAHNGVAICTAPGSQTWGSGSNKSTIASDNQGGAIITWLDGNNYAYDVYAQRVDGSGAVQWQTNGVAICIAGEYQKRPSIIPGAAGAIIAWEDDRNKAASGTDVYIQRVTKSGKL